MILALCGRFSPQAWQLEPKIDLGKRSATIPPLSLIVWRAGRLLNMESWKPRDPANPHSWDMLLAVHVVTCAG